MRCVCDQCGKEFTLSVEENACAQGLGQLAIRLCDSGGIYAVYVVCPWCEYQHDLDK